MDRGDPDKKEEGWERANLNEGRREGARERYLGGKWTKEGREEQSEGMRNLQKRRRARTGGRGGGPERADGKGEKEGWSE